ncbi:uncharacterized protein LOC120642843 isoform X2 [Panicum virgatum]|uniref:uncharacterized protein LOC120642843 isoform X2 n=1 Tax=Panicum virgatum TaxID=38727 RepID=UPI0019D50E45|nr:uncharacterized protein LOC120642843 isoform X2 [Panicum virgatum]
MDKHIVHGDEVGYDDGSCDDNHGTSEDVFSCEDDSVDKWMKGRKLKSLRLSKGWLRMPLRQLVIGKQRLQCHMGRKQPRPARRRLNAAASQLPGSHPHHGLFLIAQSPAAGASNRPNVKLPTSSGSSSASRTQDAYIVVS